MTTARQSFAMLIELIAALEDGRVPRAEVRRWFTTGADRWARTPTTMPLHACLGITRRLRRDYLVSRQRDYLDDALRAFLETHSGTPWEVAGGFARELMRFERCEHDDPGTSRLARALWLACRVGLPVPTSREHWRQVIDSQRKPIVVDGSVGAPHADGEMDQSRRHEIVRRAREQWDATPALRRQLERSDHVHAVIHDADRAWVGFLQDYATGRVPQARLDHDNKFAYAHARFDAWVATRFTAADQSSGDRSAMTTTNPSAKATTPGDVEAAARREFAASQDLREEFDGDVATYIAFRQAQARGLIRMVGVRDRRG